MTPCPSRDPEQSVQRAESNITNFVDICELAEGFALGAEPDSVYLAYPGPIALAGDLYCETISGQYAPSILILDIACRHHMVILRISFTRVAMLSAKGGAVGARRDRPIDRPHLDAMVPCQETAIFESVSDCRIHEFGITLGEALHR